MVKTNIRSSYLFILLGVYHAIARIVIRMHTDSQAGIIAQLVEDNGQRRAKLHTQGTSITPTFSLAFVQIGYSLIP